MEYSTSFSTEGVLCVIVRKGEQKGVEGAPEPVCVNACERARQCVDAYGMPQAAIQCHLPVLEHVIEAKRDVVVAQDR